MTSLVRVAAAALLLLGALPRAGWADGGALRALEHSGPWQIAAFTSPHPLVAGPVDVSLLVQDAGTLEPADCDMRVTIARRRPPGAPVVLAATAEAATNKLFRACSLELEPGSYEVAAICESRAGRGSVRFSIEVGPAPPRLVTLWPWFAWPLVPVALFGLHRHVLRRAAASRAAGHKPNDLRS